MGARYRQPTCVEAYRHFLKSGSSAGGARLAGKFRAAGWVEERRTEQGGKTLLGEIQSTWEERRAGEEQSFPLLIQ